MWWRVVENKILDNYMLLIIPSWGELLGYPTLGKYANQNVTFIDSDPVIFLTCNEGVKLDQSGSKYFLFGLGYYFTKFGYEGEKYITDSRGLTGVVLSDFVYDMAATSRDVGLNDIEELVITEKIIKIPLDLSKFDTQNVFLKGALSRNVFAPYKNVIIEFLDKIKDNQYPFFQVQQVGYSLLTATTENFDEILVSEKLKDNNYIDYMQSTAGLNQIKINSDSLLKQNFSVAELEYIKGNILILKHIYTSIEIDQMDLISFIQNARLPLQDKLNKASENLISKSKIHSFKKPILLSARGSDDQIVKWPDALPRRNKRDIESLRQFKKVQITPGTQGIVRLSNVEENIKKPLNSSTLETPTEKFELSFQKHHQVESKFLPKPPEGSAKEIILYLKNIIAEDFEMIAVGKAFEMARDNLRKIMLQSDAMWQMNKYANNLQRQKPNLSLNEKDKNEILEYIDKWALDIEEQERKERERVERERKERERIERLEKEKLEKERKERERLEKERLEKERKKKEKVEKEKLKKEELERKQVELVRLEKEKRELEALKKQRKQREAFLKEQKKLEKRKKKERKKLEKLKKKQKKVKNTGIMFQ